MTDLLLWLIFHEKIWCNSNCVIQQRTFSSWPMPRHILCNVWCIVSVSFDAYTAPISHTRKHSMTILSPRKNFIRFDLGSLLIYWLIHLFRLWPAWLSWRLHSSDVVPALNHFQKFFRANNYLLKVEKDLIVGPHCAIVPQWFPVALRDYILAVLDRRHLPGPPPLPTLMISKERWY